MKSVTSAMASVKVFGTPGFTGAMKERTVVNPSSWVLKGAEPSPPSNGSLLTKNAQLAQAEPAGSPMLMLLIETGVVVPGMSA